jgi:hypothetical protein
LTKIATKRRLVIYGALISGLTASCTHTSGSANVAAQVAAAIAAASRTRKVCLLSAPDTVARRMSDADWP